MCCWYKKGTVEVTGYNIGLVSLFIHAQTIQNRLLVTLLSLEMGSTAGSVEAKKKPYGLARANRRGQKIAHVMPFPPS